MKAQEVLAHFNRLSDAPDAVPRLRQFILELAVRGKLVDREPKDEPTSELLKHIQAEKDRRVKEGKLKKQEPLPRVRPDETWFEVPASWCWVRLGTITQVLMGQSPPGDTYNKTGAGVPLINGPVEFTEGPFGRTVVNQYTTAPTNLCEEGDLLLCVRGSTTGRTNIAGFGACIGRGVAAIRPFFADRYVRLFIWRLRDSIIAMGRGIAFPSVTRQQIEELPVPLPPLAEQDRIVAKVDELMVLCDQLDQARQKREKCRENLVFSALYHIGNRMANDHANGPARVYLAQLPRLTTSSAHLQQLRQTLLNLAVRGQLAPQNVNDEPAATVLTRIRDEKSRRIREGSLRREKPSRPVSEDELPFIIPTMWSWARIGDCSLLTEYGTSVKADHTKDGIPVLAMGNIQGGQVILDDRKKVSRDVDDLPQLFLKKFDLLYNRTNSAELVGKTGIYLGDDDTYTFASYLIRIRFLSDLTNPRYVNLAMNAPYFRQTQILPELKQQCGQANVNGSKLRNMIIPLPPRAEQERIVARVDQLMGLCDRLERELQNSQVESRLFLESVLHRALNEEKASAPLPRSNIERQDYAHIPVVRAR